MTGAGAIHLTPRGICPVCGGKLNATSSLDQTAPPSEGDLTLCVHCGSALEFDAEMRLHLAPQATVDDYQEELGRVHQHLREKSYTILPGPRGLAILCHRCGKTSHHPMDVERRFCGYCDRFHELP